MTDLLIQFQFTRSWFNLIYSFLNAVVNHLEVFHFQYQFCLVMKEIFIKKYDANYTKNSLDWFITKVHKFKEH